MLARLKISQKIYLLGLIQLGLMLVMGIIAISQMAKIGVELADIAERDIPLTSKITLITEHQFEQNVLFERLLFEKSLHLQNASNEDVLSNLATEVRGLGSKIASEILDAESFANKALLALHSEKGIKEFKHVVAEIKKIKTTSDDFNKKVNGLIDSLPQISLAELAKVGHAMEKDEEILQTQLADLSHEISRFTAEAALKAEHDEQAGVVWITAWFVIALIVGVTLPLVIGKSITTPIKLLSQRLAEIADGDGDLTISLPDKAKDELGDVSRSFNKFLGVLRVLISNTNSQADVLGDSSEIAMKAMRETVTNVEMQQKETEMVATAVNQMSMTTQDVAQSAAHAAEVTHSVTQKVSEGKHNALETQNIIKQLSEEVSEASEVIGNLVEETNSIGSVLESIQGIAAQTNLLALNAAIEAARAGESGRGFAVVADEVRTLAQRTQNSTVDIQELLLRLKAEANNAVTSMNKGNQSANSCLDKSTKTSNALDEAANSVGQISDLNAQIATAAEEQSAVAEEVNKNLVNISNLAEVTAEGARATSNANTTIAKRVIDLHTNLNVFLV